MEFGGRDQETLSRTVFSKIQQLFHPGYTFSETAYQELFRQLREEKLLKKSLPSTLIDAVLDTYEANPRPEVLKCVKAISSRLFNDNFALKSQINTAVFFPSLESEKKLIEYLRSPKRSMNVCVFTITRNGLAKALIDAHKRGVVVRVITDDQKLDEPGSDIRNIQSAGIEVRIDNRPDAHMHNKFAILDEKILINGSFNWTQGAVEKNQENLTITDNNDIVKLYQEEFEKLWQQFN